MLSFIWLLGLIIYLGIFIYNRCNLLLFTAAGLVALIAVWFLAPFSIVFKIILSALWLVLVPFNFTSLRQHYFSRPLLNFFNKVMPSISETEQQAIDAGTVNWAGDLFSGSPDWKHMLSQPGFCISQEERAFLEGPAEELCEMLDEWEIRNDLLDLPETVWDFLKEKGFFAMIIPKKYGGLGFSAAAQSSVVAKVGAVSATAASTIAVPNSLGPAELLLKYGTEEQKNYYLPRLASGEEIPCFALTSEYAGSDATAMVDRGVVCKGTFEGKEITGIQLNFDKRYITLAPIATVIGLAFKLYDPDHLLGDKTELGITSALIPRHTKEIEIGRRHFPLHTPFQNGPIHGSNVFVPCDYIIGGIKMAGKGWRMLIECLSVGRGVTMPALSVGGAKALTLATGAYARIRKQFGLPIGTFEAIQEVLARIGGFTYMMDSMRKMTLAAIDRGEKPSILASMTKYHTTELARKIVNDAMDVHGGKGICLGPNNYIGPGYESMPISITVEGANIVTRSLMIFGQGAIRAHPYVLKEMQAVSQEDRKKALADFDQAVFGHIGYMISNAIRALTLAFTSSLVVTAPKSKVSRYYQHLTRFSTALALITDFAMLTLGGNLKRKESLSARLGDVFSYLYIGSAVLKNFADAGEPEHDLPLVKWSLENLLHGCQQAVNQVIRNFPNKGIAFLMRILIYPVGRHYKTPSDYLSHLVAKLLLKPNPAREQFTENMPLSETAHYPLGRLEKTLKLVIASDGINKKIMNAMKEGKLEGHEPFAWIDAAEKTKLINESEAKLMREAQKATLQIIAVDDFAPESLLKSQSKTSRNERSMRIKKVG